MFLSNLNALPGWFIGCQSKQLRRKPISVKLLQKQIVLYRDSTGTPHALLDRCAHRGAPLSKGFIHGDNIVCCYHGWAYNEEGRCVHIPELPEDKKIPNRACTISYRVHESHGFIWINVDETDKVFNPVLDLDYCGISSSSKRYQTTYNSSFVYTNWLHLVENVVDGSHLNFIHKGSLNSRHNPFYRWSRRYRKNKIDRKYYEISDTSYGFTATLKSDRKFFCFDVVLPSTIYIKMFFGEKQIIIGVYVIPIDEKTCRVEHTFTRNFLLNSMFNPIFKWIARKYLLEDIAVVELIQKNYERYNRDWETSTTNDRLAIYIRKRLKDLLPNFDFPYKDQKILKKHLELEIAGIC